MTSFTGRIAVLAAVPALALALVACGSDEPEASPAPNGTGASAAVPGTSPQPGATPGRSGTAGGGTEPGSPGTRPGATPGQNGTAPHGQPTPPQIREFTDCLRKRGINLIPNNPNPPPGVSSQELEKASIACLGSLTASPEPS